MVVSGVVEGDEPNVQNIVTPAASYQRSPAHVLDSNLPDEDFTERTVRLSILPFLGVGQL